LRCRASTVGCTSTATGSWSSRLTPLRSVPSGARSDALLVTNLANYVQPVIRYQLGDSVVISDHGCACGAPLATISVEGRTDEILRFPLAGGGEAVIVPMAIATVVEDAGGVRRYQVLQTAPDALAPIEPRFGSGSAPGWPTCCRPTAQSTSSCAWRPNPRTRTRAAGSSDTCCRLCRRLPPRIHEGC
jgi:hypothetical protein